MKLFAAAAVLLGAMASRTDAQEGAQIENHDMFLNKPHSHVSYHHVESACAADVNVLCSTKESPSPQISGDPLVDWIFFSRPSIPTPPEVRDLNLFMDRMMGSFMDSPRPQISIMWFHEIVDEEPHFLVDSAVAKLASQREPEEIPAMAHQLQTYGKNLLESSDGHEERGRMARRLMEMDTNTIQHHVLLPFGYVKNRCLRDAVESHKVSQECAHSIQVLERTLALEDELNRRQGLFVGMMWVYIGALACLMFLLARKYRARRGSRRLKQKIILAIYSNPSLKKQVEEELGESVGNVPPLSYHVVRLLTAGGQDLKRRLRCLRRVHAVFLALLIALVFVAPFWVLPICIMVTLARVLQLCMVNHEAEAEDCACCCCGMSAGDYARIVKDDPCCSCCKGTGICSSKCQACCGSCGCCTCCCTLCTDGECCCSPSVTIQTNIDCTCCCCAATPALARAGLLTAEQACCNCCKGTGVCAPSCATCCGGSCCGCCCSCCSSGNCCRTHVQLPKNGGRCCMEGVSCGVSSLTVSSKGDCKCCCCAATPALSEAGLLTTEQACCKCCNGTGVCAPSCATCCGGSCCGCCCSGCVSGDCCRKHGKGQKHVVLAKHVIYEGIPLQVV